MEDIMKEYKGRKYNETFMLEQVNLHPKLKEKLEQAKEEFKNAESNLEDAKFNLEDVELEWQNHIGEWEGFKPFEDALKKQT